MDGPKEDDGNHLKKLLSQETKQHYLVWQTGARAVGGQKQKAHLVEGVPIAEASKSENKT